MGGADRRERQVQLGDVLHRWIRLPLQAHRQAQRGLGLDPGRRLRSREAKSRRGGIQLGSMGSARARESILEARSSSPKFSCFFSQHASALYQNLLFDLQKKKKKKKKVLSLDTTA